MKFTKKSLENMLANNFITLDKVRFAVVDVETTGLDLEKDRICEIAVIVIYGLEEVNSFTSLINPQIPIPPEITRINGITDEMVLKMPSFYDLKTQIMDIMNNAVIVGHNVDFDLNFIKSEFKRAGYILEHPYKIDTLTLSRKILNLRDYKLETIARSMNLFSDSWHRAYNDALMTSRIFKNLLNFLIKESNVSTLYDLLKIAN